MAAVPPERATDLLRTMLRMSRLEERVLHFGADHEGLLRGHYHVYIGQEAAGAAACAHLRPNDYVFTTHRNHGHVVAKGGDLGRVLAELAPDIQWQQSYVADDKTFCVYLAKNEDVIRKHAEVSGFPATKITEVKRMIDPTTANA